MQRGHRVSLLRRRLFRPLGVLVLLLGLIDVVQPESFSSSVSLRFSSCPAEKMATNSSPKMKSDVSKSAILPVWRLTERLSLDRRSVCRCGDITHLLLSLCRQAANGPPGQLEVKLKSVVMLS